MDIAFKISDRVSFITPGRYLFNAGKTPKEWNNKILSDKHFKVIWYESDSTKVFPSVDIKGGVAVTFRDATQKFGSLGVFTQYNELSSIANKVYDLKGFNSLSDIIFTQNKFNLNAVYKDFPRFRKVIGSNGKEKRLTTSIFEQIDIFKNKPYNGNSVKILGLINNKRVSRYISEKYLDKHENLMNFKVLLPKSNGTGKLGEELSSPHISNRMSGFTQSFISIGNFKTEQEANSCLKYIKTKFSRTLLGVLKVTQDNNKDVWQFVPLQDFTNKSDIDWSKSVEEIDHQLYKKYELSKDEIVFIEKMIKPMK